MEHEEHTFAFLHSNVKGLIIQNIMIPVSSKSYFFKKKRGGGSKEKVDYAKNTHSCSDNFTLLLSIN